MQILIRKRNSTKYGSSFSASTIQAVWEKGTIVPGYNKDQVRKDKCGARIERYQNGNTLSSRGWEIDHIMPVSQGGSDELYNLQPLQWENNRHKGDDYPNWSCKIRS